MNILVTGGSGNLAKYIAQEFADHDLMLMDLLPPPADRARLPFIQGDLANYEDCAKAVAACQPEVILAPGAVPYPTDGISRARREAEGQKLPPFDMTMRSNVLGLYYLMQCAVEAKVKAVIQTSSIVAVESDGTNYRYLPIDDVHPGSPSNSYNYSKIAGELMLQWFTRTYGIQTLCPRPAWNWTPEMSQKHAREVQPVTAWANYLWHYVDTRDVAHAHRSIFDAMDRLPKHDAYLLHAADHQCLEDSRELVQKLRPDLIGKIPVYLRGRQAFYSCERAHNAFGFKARYSWTDYA